MKPRRLHILAALLFALVAGTCLAADTQRSFEYSERHQLLHIRHVGSPALDVAFTYDANGNRTSKTQGGTTTVYRWNLQDRLVEVLRDGNWIARYAYDAEGRRVEKIVNGSPSPSLTRYAWDGRHVVREINAVGNTLATYEWVGDRLLTSKRNGQRFYYQHDALGSIVIESAADGGLYARYGYDSWGNPTRSFGNPNNPHLFTGYPFDDETGLHYANARYYDSDLGAFLSVDPAQGQPAEPVTFHPYLYGRGNPLIYVDPDGRTAELQHVLRGFERNRQSVVAFADVLKARRERSGLLERYFIDQSLAGAALLNAANYVGEGVTATANAGANIALSLADNYLVDLGRGADAANAELDEIYKDFVPAVEKAADHPLDALARGAQAFAEPYEKAYDGDTQAQLDVVANLDPRRFGKNVLHAIAEPGEPKIGGAQAMTVVEGADGQPAFRPAQQAPLAPLEVGTYGALTRQGTVGDNLTPDHIPSFAAVRARAERQGGQPLSRQEAAELRRSTNCIAIGGCQHRESSRTYGGRNTPSQILEDSLDLGAAQERDIAALRARLLADGYSEAQLDQAFERLRQENLRSGQAD